MPKWPDFRNMSLAEAIEFLGTKDDEKLKPLVQWLGEALAYRNSNDKIRLALADAEHQVEVYRR